MPKPLTETERQEFLAGRHIAVLSATANDGRPPVAVPIWYDYTPGGNITISTSAGSRKARFIEETGMVTLTVQQEELPYRYVIVEGTVIDSITPAPRAPREAIATRYLGPELGRAFVDQMSADTYVLFTIRPDRWISRDYSDNWRASEVQDTPREDVAAG